MYSVCQMCKAIRGEHWELMHHTLMGTRQEYIDVIAQQAMDRSKTIDMFRGFDPRTYAAYISDHYGKLTHEQPTH